MKFFWNTVDTIDITGCSGFSHFDMGHLIWLVVFMCFAALCCIIYRHMPQCGLCTEQSAGASTQMDIDSEKHAIEGCTAPWCRKHMRAAFAILLIANEMLKYAVVLVNGVTILRYLPLQLCSISIILVIIHSFLSEGRTRRYIGNFLYLVGLPAGLSALLFPSWTALPAFANIMSIHSFAAHILMVTYIIMLMTAGEIVPDLRTIPVIVIALTAMTVGVFAFDSAFEMNYMYLIHISPGSPLKPFEALGDYRLGYIVILAGLVIVMYGIPALGKTFHRIGRSRD